MVRRKSVKAVFVPEPELANASVGLALEWGENWLEPIQERLGQIRPDLSKAELDACQTLARRVFDQALEAGRDALKRHGLDSGQAPTALRSALLADFPWLDEASLGSLVSQSLYYARK